MFETLIAYKAIADASRLRMMLLLARNELAVTDLTRILRQSQPRVSRHLKILTDAGLIERYKEGAWVFYRLAGVGRAADVARGLVEMAATDSLEHAKDIDRLGEIIAARIGESDVYFASHAAEWDHIRSLHVSEAEVETAIIDALSKRPIGHFLDIGTGTGRVLEIMAPHVSRGVGVDISREMLGLARARLERRGYDHCQVRLADMYDLPKDSEGYDTITLHQVLHFADDPQQVVAEAASVLRPDGQILVVDFAPHDNEALRDQHSHRRLGFADDQMLHYLSETGLRGEVINHLTGGELTVTLWRAEKKGVHA